MNYTQKLFCMNWGVFILTGLILFSCGDKKSQDVINTPVEDAFVTVKMRADFTSKTSPTSNQIQNHILSKTNNLTSLLGDGPDDQSGSDNDGDGGVVRFITPSQFKVAIKSLTFIKDDNTRMAIITAAAKLQESRILDLKNEITLPIETLPAGNYPILEMELYYFEIKMPINDPSVDQTIRVYLSDDDFSPEGSLGHHQGDITLIGSGGGELGWVAAGLPWTVENLLSNRGNTKGAGGVDAETGHLRGLYGDKGLWNQGLFMQGGSRDIFIFRDNLNLTLSSNASKTIEFKFNVKDSWFYEDFDGNQLFNPCSGGSGEERQDACAQGAAWSPIFEMPEIIIN